MRNLWITWLLAALTTVNAESLRVLADDNAMPKNWLEDGQAKGIMIELLAEVTERTGIEFEYDFGPWNRVFSLSQAGKGAIIGFSKTAERELLWDYSVPMYYDELVLVTTKDKEFDYSGVESLTGKRIAIKRGARYGDDFEAAIAAGHIQLVETSDRAGQMRMMTADRVDAVLLSPGKLALASVIAENDWLLEHESEFVIISPAFKKDPNFLGIPKQMNASHLLPTINKALEEIHADGRYQEIVDHQVSEFLNRLAP